MKPRHQIKFKRRPSNPTTPAKKAIKKVILGGGTKKCDDVTKTTVQVGERQLNFARALSDTEKSIRDASLSSLREWLTANASALDSNQWDRLWKGLFYCVWMADKPRVITSVVQNVVNLADISGWPFLNALFVCLMREWFGIDRHRVNKFYELASAALHKCLSLVLSASNTPELFEGTQTLMRTLRESIWNNLQNGGLGLALHVLDVYIDIVLVPVLVKANQLHLKNEELMTLSDTLLADILKLISPERVHQPALHIRIRDRILLQIVPMMANEQIKLDPSVQRDVVDRAAKLTFAIAADKRTAQEERQALYDTQGILKTFVMKCDKQARLSDKDGTVEPPKTSGA